MRLLELDIQRMPGFETRGFCYPTFGKGITIIWGPNGSGKTTTSKALRALLWPHLQQDLSPVLLRSTWEQDGEISVILREASKSEIPSRWLEALQKAEPKVYTLVLDDVLDHEHADLSGLIAEEIKGGYDFLKIRERYALGPKWGYAESAELPKLQRSIETILRDQKTLAAKEEDLLGLTQKIQKAKAAEQKIQQIDKTFHYHDLKKRIDSIEARLQEFPSGITNLRDEDESELAEVLSLPHADCGIADLPKATLRLSQGKEIYEDLKLVYEEIRRKTEDIESLKEALSGHAAFLQITKEELIEVSSQELNLLRRKGLQEESFSQMKEALDLWFTNKRRTWVSKFSWGVASLGLLLLAFAYTQELFPIKLLAIGLMTAPLLQLCLRSSRIDGDDLVKAFQEKKIANVDFDLWMDEVRRARDTIVELRKKESLLQRSVEQKTELSHEFFVLFPQSEHIGYKDLLDELEYQLVMQKNHDHLQKILLRTQTHSDDPLRELRTKKKLVIEHRNLLDEKTRYEGRIEQAHKELVDRQLCDLSYEVLLDMQEEAKLLSASLPTFQNEETEIRSSLTEASRNLKFEEASDNFRKASEELKKKEETWQGHVLGAYLLDSVEEEFEKNTRPEIIRVANHYFELFTHGKMRLDAIVRGKETHFFKIFDVASEKHVLIDALSRGTALQLLLAVRLGFITAQESKIKLPLILDEVLSHVDDDRFEAIADALVTVAKEGRQILIFTCGRSSQAMWKRIAGPEQDGLIHFVDLQELKGAEKRERTPIVFSPYQAQLRLPLEGETVFDYAKEIGLPGFDGEIAASQQPVWLVLSSAQELYQTVLRKIGMVGQFKEPSWRKDLFERFMSLVKTGRPPKLWRDDLEKAVRDGVFTDKFLEAIDECANKYDRNGNLLLEALKRKEVKRFQEKNLEKFEEYFSQKGYIDLRDSLPLEKIREELWNRVPSVTAESGSYIDYLIHLYEGIRL